MTDRLVGVTDQASGAGVAEVRARERTVGGNTVAEQYVIPIRERVVSYVGIYSSAVVSGLAAAPATTAANFYLTNNPGSGVLVAVRRAEAEQLLTAASVTVTRFGIEKFTTTTSATAAEATFVARDTTEAHSPSVKLTTASTGLTIANNVPAFAWLAPTMVTSGAMVPVTNEWEPSDDGMVILRAGQGILFRQLDAGATTQRVQVDMAWEEFTLP